MNAPEKTIYDKIENRLYKQITKRVEYAESILDVGCGHCKLVNILAKKTESKIVGVDIDGWKFADGLKEAVKLGVLDNIECIEVDARSLPSSFNEKFDATVSIYALHEYGKPLKVLREVNKALKPDGKILIIDFIKGSTAEKLWFERYYTPKQIKSLLKKA